jgi:multidrug transporter EmrE-like cation transporter
MKIIRMLQSLFNGVRWNTIGLGLLMATIDVFVLSFMKLKSIGTLNGWVLPVAVLVYSMQPIIFYKSLGQETMTVMNLFWDLSSDVLVTLVGLFVFKEYLTPRRMAGVGLSMISLFLLAGE